MSKQTDTAKRWTRALVHSGIILYLLLGGITAVWWTAEGALSATYSLVMIPMSAVGVIAVFAGLIVLVLAEIRQNRIMLARVASDVGKMKAAALRAHYRLPAESADDPEQNGQVPQAWLEDMAESIEIGKRWRDRRRPDGL